MKTVLLALLCLGLLLRANAQTQLQYIPAEVDFSEKVSEWDGFGFNYVEASQHRDYFSDPQDYGGFSLLNEQKKGEIAQLVFGEEGLGVQIVKMFLDPFHQESPTAAFDHESTTQYMREFVQMGMDITRGNGDELEIITTLYGPPAWATQQKFVGGRDLDPAQIDPLCNYLIDWVRYLKEEGYPVKYLSLHNEGEDFYRWNFEEGTQRFEEFDYNLYWPPAQVNQFLKILPEKMEAAGLSDIKVTNGEPSNWTRFHLWGYTQALYDDAEALANLGLLTTHGFVNGNRTKLSYGLPIGSTTRLLREKKPNLHAWITSYSWGESGLDFLRTAHEQIYTAKVNALIPWAGIQVPARWVGGDPNSSTAITVKEDGSYELLPWYYFYKQLTQAGHRGMSVCRATLANPVAFLIAFGQDDTQHPDAFVVSSDIFIWKLPLEIKVKGTESIKFRAFRTLEDGSELYKEVGVFEVQNGAIIYDPPKGSTTTFIAID